MIHRVLVGAVSDRERHGEVSADDAIIQQCLNWIGLFAADSRSYKKYAKVGSLYHMHSDMLPARGITTNVSC
jgi:hypothetical protein